MTVKIYNSSGDQIEISEEAHTEILYLRGLIQSLQEQAGDLRDWADRLQRSRKSLKKKLKREKRLIDLLLKEVE